MPSDFVQGRPQPKTLADLIRTLEEGPKPARPPFVSSPVSNTGRVQAPRKSGRDDEANRRRYIQRQALKGLTK